MTAKEIIVRVVGGGPMLIFHRRFPVHSIASLVVGLSLFGGGRQAALAGANFRGDLLVDDFNGQDILAFNPTNGSYQGVFATMPGGAGPSYMAEGPNGNIYVGTYFSGSAVEFDGATGAQITGFNLQPQNPQAIITGLTFDSQGNLYAIDSKVVNGGRIDEYNATTGVWEKEIASGLSTPRGLAYADGNLYVTVAGNPTNGGIDSFTLSGSYNGLFGQSANYLRPEGLTVGPNGNLFATDGQSSVYQFTPAGRQVGSGPYATSNLIVSTYGAGFGPDGSLYVVDTIGPVYKFDSDGNLIGTEPFIPQTGAGYDLQYPVAPFYDSAAVPEPTSIILLLTGLTCLLFGKRAVDAL